MTMPPSWTGLNPNESAAGVLIRSDPQLQRASKQLHPAIAGQNAICNLSLFGQTEIADEWINGRRWLAGIVPAFIF
jgi:hypothetical protein